MQKLHCTTIIVTKALYLVDTRPPQSYPIYATDEKRVPNRAAAASHHYNLDNQCKQVQRNWYWPIRPGNLHPQ